MSIGSRQFINRIYSVVGAILFTCILSFTFALGLAHAQNGELPRDYYDPQRLQLGNWLTYDGSGTQPDISNPDINNWKPLTSATNTLRPGTVRWYRLDFTIGWHFRTRDLGLYLGIIEQAHKIYLNGKYLDEIGKLSPESIDSASKPSLTALPRLGVWYSFMSLSRPNTLIVAVESFTESVRFQSAAIIIDDMDRLLLKTRETEASIKIVQGAATSILLLIALFCGFLFVSGLRGASNLIFGLFVFSAAIIIFLDSLIFYDFSSRLPMVDRFLTVGRLMCAILFCNLVKTEVSGNVSRRLYNIQFVVISVFIIIAIFAPNVSLFSLDFVSDIFAIAFIGLTLWPEHGVSKTMFFSMKRMMVLSIIFLVAYLYQFLQPAVSYSLSTIQSVYILISFTFLFLIAQRYQELSRHLGALSQRLVVVRDLERARLARDMHDGIGQGVAAIGLHLKILAAKMGGKDFKNLTQSLDDLNLQLTEVIGDLRPSILQGQSLGIVIERHFERALTGTGINYDYAIDKKASFSRDIKEQLFRIYQEALNNALKHSECKNIFVELSRKGRKIILKVQEDGIGFSVDEKRDLGLGLSTMRERASLINGVYKLKSSIGGGTEMQIEVTLDD